MGKGRWANPWLRHIAIAVTYGIAVVLFRELSVSYWMILAGLRLSVFLLTPYRYWPALMVGESGYFVWLSYECASVWGTTWAIANVAPPALFLAPVIFGVREHWQPVKKNVINIGAVLTCALMVSLVSMLRDLLMVRLMVLPAGYELHVGETAARYFIGSYLGILTVTPLVLAAYQVTVHGGWRQLYAKMAASRLVYESTCLGLPVLAFLLWVGASAPAHSETRQMVQVAMFLPVVWLALRHGWQGATVGGTVASCAVKALMPALYDHTTIQSEILVAFAISTMLLAGARIATLDRRAEQERADVRSAFALAQRNVYLGEMQMRMASQTLEQVRETVQVGFSMVLGRLRHLQPALDDRGYQRHALVAQEQLHRLADSLYPTTMRERGLPTVLREGAMARLLDEAGVAYSCDVRGSLSPLSHAVRMTIYRIVSDVIADACSRRDVSDIRVRIHGKEKDGRRGALISVHLRTDPVSISLVHWDDLLAYIARTTSGLGLRSIQDRAGIFEGSVKTRTSPEGRCISVFLLDPIAGGG